MTEQIIDQPTEFNEAELEWVWVLISSPDPENDSIVVVEMDDSNGGASHRVVPIFTSREIATYLRERLGSGPESTAQTMRLTDVGHFAAQHNLEIMLLNQDGGIVAHLAAEIGQAS